jgi:branched-subunit amino acid transport protein
MTSTWTVIAVLAVGTLLIKAAGPLMLGRRELPEPVVGVVALLVPALLAALIVEQTVGSHGTLTVDARAAGIVAAVIALALRMSLAWVLLAAATSTALVRFAF